MRGESRDNAYKLTATAVWLMRRADETPDEGTSGHRDIGMTRQVQLAANERRENAERGGEPEKKMNRAKQCQSWDLVIFSSSALAVTLEVRRRCKVREVVYKVAKVS